MSEDFENESAWELSSGLPLDGATVTITASEFGFRQNIAKETVFACFEFTPDEGEAREQCYSVGKGWNAVEKGAAIKRADGKKGAINDSTGYGKWIAEAVGKFDAKKREWVGGIEACRQAIMKRGGDPLRASTWTGARFVLGTIKEDTTNPTTGQKKEATRVIPTEFLGFVGEAASSSAKVASKSEADAVIDDELLAKLTKIAEESDSHDDFMAAAFEVEGVAGVPAIESLVMSNGKGSIWSKAKA